MINVKPLKGYRPSGGNAQKVPSAPYDIYTDDEYRKIAEDNPCSFVHVIRSDVDFPAETNHYTDDIYRKGRANLESLITEGHLKQDDSDCIYIYRQTMNNHSQTGFFLGVNVYDYESGLVKKHENTREKKEKDRISHIELLNAHTGPSFLTYRSEKTIDCFLDDYSKGEPDFKVTAEDGVIHELWVVDDENVISKIVEAFRTIDALYIADGHHRTKASVEVAKKRDNYKTPVYENEYHYILSVVFPDSQLEILPYNRVIKDLNGMTMEEFFKKLEIDFTVSNPSDKVIEPSAKSSFSMYINHKWYLLRYKKEISDDPVKSLDVSILQETVLSPMLDIKDPRKSERIDFIGGIRGSKYLEKLVDDGSFQLAFLMYPTSMDELLNVADHDLLMPPKSTWFEPKLRSGMVVHLLD